MRIDINGHQIEITQALRDYVQDKLQRLERHSEHLLDGHVILSVEKLEKRAEATIHLSGQRLHAESAGEDMYAAIDLLADKLDRQVVKHKEKLTNHHRGEATIRDARFG